jgi:hypothetical protein
VLFSPQILVRSRGGSGGGGGGGAGTTASAFLARAATARGSPLDSTHISAFTTLLNGMDSGGLTVQFDWLHWYGTQDSVSALLNMVSTSFNGTAHGSPTFTADRGFTGSHGSSTVFIDTGFNSTVGTPQFQQSNGHISAWSVTNIGSDSNGLMGTRASANTIIYPDDGGSALLGVNDTGFPGVANSNSSGHYIASRTGSSSFAGYRNGSSIISSGASSFNQNLNMYVLADNLNGTAEGSAYQCLMASQGKGWSATDALNFFNLARACATALGVP